MLPPQVAPSVSDARKHRRPPSSSSDLPFGPDLSQRVVYFRGTFSLARRQSGSLPLPERHSTSSIWASCSWQTTSALGDSLPMPVPEDEESWQPFRATPVPRTPSTVVLSCHSPQVWVVPLLSSHPWTAHYLVSSWTLLGLPFTSPGHGFFSRTYGVFPGVVRAITLPIAAFTCG